MLGDSISSCSPFQVDFTNTSLYATSVKWIFGDNTTSTLPQPTHYYSVPGTYIARLAVAGPGGCVDTVNKVITLYLVNGYTNLHPTCRLFTITC